jgi:CHAT domain-containing protein/tetratricopeptide (TPR) repeat protein
MMLGKSELAALLLAMTLPAQAPAPAAEPPLTPALEREIEAARALQKAGDLPAALAAFTAAVEHAREAGDRRAEAVAWRMKGVVRFYQFDYEGAVAEYRKCAEVAEASGNRTQLAHAFLNTGAAYLDLGEYARAQTYFEKAAFLYEAVQNNERLTVAYSNIGVSLAERGDHASALTYFNKALRLAEAIGSTQRVLAALNSIGAILIRQRDYLAGLEYYERGAAIAREIGDGKKLALALTGIGLTYQQTHDYPRALEQLTQALDVAETHDRSLLPRILAPIGAIHMAQGRLDEAEALYERGLKLVDEIGSRLETATFLIDVARLRLARRDHRGAVEAAERGARLAAEIESPDALWQLSTLAGRAHVAQGRAADAQGAFARGIAAIEMLQKGVAGGAEQEQRAFEDKLEPYHGLMELALAAGRTADAFQQAERAKGRVLLGVLQGGQIRSPKATTPEQEEKEQGLNAALVSINARIVAEAAAAQPDAGRLRELRAERDRLRVEREALLATLYTARPEARALRGEMAPAGVDEAAGALGLTDAALEFVATDERVHAFLLTRDGRGGRVQHYTLAPGGKELAEEVAAFRGQLANRDPAFRPVARRLFDWVLGPVARELRQRSRLVIVPDGPLWELPFQALLTDRSRYLLEDHAVQYAPSLTVLREMIARRSRVSSSQLLVVGNPTLPGPAANARLSTLRDAKLTPLPEAEREAKALARLYRSRAGAALYIGPQAEEKRIKAEAARYGVLHFATHGILDDHSPMNSYLLLSAPAPARAEAAAEDDGILEAREILDLDLRAQLVVLSACEMARGRYGPGEGIIGMSWALFAAGSPAAVLAHWNVDSASTTRLMIDFHRHLLGTKHAGRLPKSEALRRAALGRLRSGPSRHPFYWAGFAVIGEDSPLSPGTASTTSSGSSR